MEKKKVIIISSVIALVIIIVGVLVSVCIYNKKRSDSKGIISLGNYVEKKSKETGYVFTSLEEFNKYFNNSNLKGSDFSNNNYALIEIKYDICSIKDIELSKYTLEGNNIDVTIDYKRKCDFCDYNYMYYLLRVNKDITNVKVEFDYNIISDEKCKPVMPEKPIIYLYPTTKTDVSVKLLNEEKLTTTYPKYENSWEVVAHPNGLLIDKKTGRELYSLYWEGKDFHANIEKDGFIVKGEDTINFLEEKLAILGLNEREADEFIIYWLPQLENNKYNYIRFASIEEINEYMPIEINPKPDTLIRILMLYKPLNKKIEVKEQELITPDRDGFTAVEWGGSLIN